MARRRKKDAAEEAALDETEWEDWRALRAELGKRLGGGDATGASDSEGLDAARIAARKGKGRRR